MQIQLLSRPGTPSLARSILLSLTAFIASVALLLLTPALHGSAQAKQRPESRVADARNFIEVTDEAGRRVRIPQPVRRIVSLAPSMTELVFALGAGNKLVADTDYCDYPPEAVAKPKVGGAINPSIEQIVAFRPDLVLMTKTLNRRETVVALDQLAIVSYATDTRTVEALLGSFQRVGELIGEGEAGRRLAESSRARLDSLKRRLGTLPRRRVFFVVWLDPLITIGRDTFLADALRWAGAESIITTAQDWPQVSLEEVIHLQPEYLIFANSGQERGAQNAQALTALPGWRNLDAVKNKRIAIVSEAIDRPSPRLIDAIEELAHQVHPAAFKDALDSHNYPREFASPYVTCGMATLQGTGPSCVR
jgi:iron complex transport system substrate-binding protein